MGHPIRMFGSNDCWFITVRNFQARKLMTPRSALVREVCGGVLARAVKRYGVKLHGYVFLSNHLHLIVRAQGVGIASFMQYLLSNLARKLIPLCKARWWGRFWERRYSAAPILDEDSLETLLRYVVSHGVKEGLVAATRDWEGLHCAEQLVDETPRRFKWFDWTKRWNARACSNVAPNAFIGRYAAEFAEDEVLELAPLPQWERIPAPERRAAAARLVLELEQLHRREHVLGMKAVKREGISIPLKRKRGTRPLCHAQSKQARHQHREDYWAFVRAFRIASSDWRKGRLKVEFPVACFKPHVSSELLIV